jgi:hypothetical protein
METPGQMPDEPGPQSERFSDDPAAPEFDYTCPRCGERLTEYVDSCPSCGADLAEEFSVTYHVPVSRTGRRIALGILIALAVLLVFLVLGLLSQLLATTPPDQ